MAPIELHTCGILYPPVVWLCCPIPLSSYLLSVLWRPFLTPCLLGSQFDVELWVPLADVEHSTTLQLQAVQSERLRGVRALVVGDHAVRQEIVAGHLRR
jgi:hypothetical protein